MDKKLEKYFNGDTLAATVWKSKYATVDEETPEDMHRRMAKEFARVEFKNLKGKKNGSNFSDFGNHILSEWSKRTEQELEEIIFSYFDRFSYIVPQGSIMSMLGNKYKIGSLSNCFVIGQPYDSYAGIMQKDQELVQLMKRRGGVGIDISSLRPSTTVVSNAAGTSTGAVSFMHRYSNSTREVAQNGRRGALMISIDCRHPDVLDFINVKKDLTQVTGANISVQLRDDFMEAVKADGDYILRFPCNMDIGYAEYANKLPTEYNILTKAKTADPNVSIYHKRVKAREYFNTLVENNWISAEPGSIFVDRHWNYSPDGVYPQYKGVTTNPCGEIFMQMYDACRLMALNYFSFVKNAFEKNAQIDYELLYEMSYIQQRLADDLVDLEIEHIDRILAKIDADEEPTEVKATERALWENIKHVASSGRRTGCGFTALGDMLAAFGVKYDSEEGQEIIKLVSKTKMRGELDSTIDMAIERGTFEGWNYRNEYTTNVYMEGVKYFPRNDFYKMLLEEFPIEARKMYEFGRRNVSWSTVAPTGTVSLLTQTSSGLEPLFAAFYFRNKKVNPGETNVRVDYVDQNGDSWMEYPVLHPKFKDWACNYEQDHRVEEYSKEAIQALFEKSPWYGSQANDIDWIKRVEIQAIIQKYTTHSISSTINLPETVTKEKIAEIYMQSWELGLKGVTIYRDNSRMGVLVTESNKKKEETFIHSNSVKRPKEIDGELHIASIKGQKYGVIIGSLENKPYEVFAFELKDEIKNACKGKIIKQKKGHYSFKSDYFSMENIQSETLRNEEQVLTRLISGMLRHGAAPLFIMEQIDKCNLEVISFGKAISRVLKKYIKDEDLISRSTCGECGSTNLKREEGCLSCLDCGYSRC